MSRLLACHKFGCMTFLFGLSGSLFGTYDHSPFIFWYHQPMLRTARLTFVASSWMACCFPKFESCSAPSLASNLASKSTAAMHLAILSSSPCKCEIFAFHLCALTCVTDSMSRSRSVALCQMRLHKSARGRCPCGPCGCGTAA
ncbi:unnamed protein product [Prorocentrum cordatum]|uniref:Secreted protein n=1 Tax=Prorocentrum cordatum TaxID=2364126 RepID=A0ABN9Q570_9DINO|nr:unnamed protein product [Polarella glacialis]